MCGVTVEASYLKTHMARIYYICILRTRGVDELGECPSTYVVSFPIILQEVDFPVPGLPAISHSAGRLQKHFMYLHFRSKLAVVQ